MFAMSDEFDGLVRPGKEERWLEVKERWFCKTSDCKIPGKLKIGQFYFFISFFIKKLKKKRRRRGHFWLYRQKATFLEIMEISKGIICITISSILSF